MTFPTTTYDGFPNVPVVSDLPQKVLEAISAPGALEMAEWHTCGSAHCWAGWIVHLAGRQGYLLEAEHESTSLAAILISEASGYPIPKPRHSFYESNDQARKLIQEWAA